MKRLILLASVLLLAGCTCDLNKCEELVGACEKQKEIIEGPPVKVFIEMPQITVPQEVMLGVEQWTDEEIEANPVGYEEALINDLLRLVDANVSLVDYLSRLEVARVRLQAEANP